MRQKRAPCSIRERKVKVTLLGEEQEGRGMAVLLGRRSRRGIEQKRKKKSWI